MESSRSSYQWKKLKYNEHHMTKNSQLLVDIGKGLSLAIGLPTIGSWKTSTRPVNAKRGTFGFNTETSSLEYWNGSDWFRVQMNKK